MRVIFEDRAVIRHILIHLRLREEPEPRPSPSREHLKPIDIEYVPCFE